jgi:hypothetical protein
MDAKEEIYKKHGFPIYYSFDLNNANRRIEDAIKEAHALGRLERHGEYLARYIGLAEFGGVYKAKNNKWIFLKDNIFDMIEFVQLQEEGKAPKKMISLKEIQKRILKK